MTHLLALTPYEAFAIGRIVLSLALATIFLALALEWLPARWVRPVAVGALAAGLLAYPNFGVFHPTQIGRVIHYWDAFHYFMGAKYLPELGYSRLYDATIVAGREMGALKNVAQIRDLTTYRLRETSAIDADDIRGRFSATRWLAFKRDLAFFGRHIREWPGPLFDHGYNDSPPRAWLLHVLLRWMPASLTTLIVLTSLDYLLLLGALIALWRAFGLVPAALACSSLALSFFARFDFIGGSILRWDWTAALLLGVAALSRGAGRTAGLLLGYAALARLFPALLLLPLAVKWVQARLTGARETVLDRCLASATALAIAAAGLLLVGGQAGLVKEYAARISLHSAEVTGNSVGLGSLIVFNTAPWSLDAVGASVIGPAAAVAARPAPWLLWLAALVCAIVSVPLILRSRVLPSLMYGVPLIYCAFSPSGYYYTFLVLLVLLPWEHGGVNTISLATMALLTGMMASLFTYDFVLADMLPLFNAATIQLGLFFLLWLAFEHVRVGGGRGRSILVGEPAPLHGATPRPAAPLDVAGAERAGP